MDTTWLQRKNQLIPTSEDLSVLTSPEPLIEFICDVENSTLLSSNGNSSTNKAIVAASASASASTVGNNPFHLQSSISNDRILPSYSMHLDSESVFGSIHATQLEYSKRVQQQQDCSGNDSVNRIEGQWDDSIHHSFHDRYAPNSFF